MYPDAKVILSEMPADGAVPTTLITRSKEALIHYSLLYRVA